MSGVIETKVEVLAEATLTLFVFWIGWSLGKGIWGRKKRTERLAKLNA